MCQKALGITSTFPIWTNTIKTAILITILTSIVRISGPSTSPPRPSPPQYPQFLPTTASNSNFRNIQETARAPWPAVRPILFPISNKQILLLGFWKPVSEAAPARETATKTWRVLSRIYIPLWSWVGECLPMSIVLSRNRSRAINFSVLVGVLW